MNPFVWKEEKYFEHLKAGNGNKSCRQYFLSGRHALKAKLVELGFHIDGKELEDLFWRFKSVAEKKKNVTDDDLIALVFDEVFRPEVIWKLREAQVRCGRVGLSTATVKLIDADGKEHVACSVGTGPVDAAYKAVDLIVQVPVTLLEYSLNAVTEGIDAIATTRVLIRGENGHMSTHALTGQVVSQTFSGTGAEMDIVVSSVRAYVGALNKMLSFENRLEEKKNALKWGGNGYPGFQGPSSRWRSEQDAKFQE